MLGFLFEGRFASIKEMKDKFGTFIGDLPKNGGAILNWPNTLKPWCKWQPQTSHKYLICSRFLKSAFFGGFFICQDLGFSILYPFSLPLLSVLFDWWLVGFHHFNLKMSLVKEDGLLCSSSFKLRCMNTWNKQCIKKEREKKREIHMDSLEQCNCN